MKIISVVGARPNFMKIAPFIRAVQELNEKEGARIDHLLVHTGQHYDDEMSRAFFHELGIPEADINLGIGSGSHAEQVGLTMIAFEKVLRQEKPDWVVVVGDVNATCACSITAKKENVRLAHIEAGLRSWDMTMPEEVNRLVTDRLSDLLFSPDPMSSQNLLREGVPEDRIRLVGNIMIDTLEAQRGKAQVLDIQAVLRQNSLNGASSTPFALLPGRFALVTLHRPSNVDDSQVLGKLVQFFTQELTRELTVFWTIHPRTQRRLKDFGLWERVLEAKNLVPLRPLGYHETLRLNLDAAMVLTDSGGLQEECCVLGTPCLTLRWNTERPVTLVENGGVSVLVGNDVQLIRRAVKEALGRGRKPHKPHLWDGKTAERIVRVFNHEF